MITGTNRRQIYDPDAGFLYVDVRAAGYAAGEAPSALERVFVWHSAAQQADCWQAEHVDRFFAEPICPLDRKRLEIVPAPQCSCCGAELSGLPGAPRLITVVPHVNPRGRAYRCDKHGDRNPCAIEGCARTTAANGHFSNDVWLCHDHWKRLVPPGSRARRAYHGFFRRAKRHGWDDDIRRRFWRFWDALVRMARRRMDLGRIDEDEINRLFGWEEAA